MDELGNAHAVVDTDDSTFVPSAPPPPLSLTQPVVAAGDGPEPGPLPGPPGIQTFTVATPTAQSSRAQSLAQGLLARMQGSSPSRMVAEPGSAPRGASASASASAEDRPMPDAVPTSMQEVLMKRIETVENTLFNRLRSRMDLLEPEMV